MRLNKLAFALLCGAALAAPAFTPAIAQTPAATATVPAKPVVPTTATPAKPIVPAATAPTTTPAVPTKATTTATTSAPAPQGTLTNINTASAADLDKLPQIGKARAKKIIENRPYKAIDELVSKKALSQGVFNKIKDKITVG